jgi:glycogen operon protein
LDNELYYLVDAEGRYLNFTGCGNTLNCNHPVVRDLLMTCLRYWVGHMHVDGLRFDLASILGRDRFGNVLVDPPVVESIIEDGVLADTKLIAEPWDAAGVYQVGRFPYGRRWSEWNGRFRDDVRRFWRGDADMEGPLASRMCGSSDIYRTGGRTPIHSINFVTCHDGFTLNDLVSFERKHNLANGEEGRDGSDANFSFNCGVEGLTNDPAVIQLRLRQAKNLMATLLLSQGVPMLLAGDEFLRTQHGNNNAWCQDNEVSWVDWSLREKNTGFFRFVRSLIHLRKRHPIFRRRDFLREGDVIWHSPNLDGSAESGGSGLIVFCLDGRQTGREADSDFCIAINGSGETAIFATPPAPSGGAWQRVVDTARAGPDDFVEEDEGPRIELNTPMTLAPHSLVVLVSKHRSVLA